MGKQDKKNDNNTFNEGGNNENRTGGNSNSNGRERNVGHENAEEHSVKTKSGGRNTKTGS